VPKEGLETAPECTIQLKTSLIVHGGGGEFGADSDAKCAIDPPVAKPLCGTPGLESVNLATLDPPPEITSVADLERAEALAAAADALLGAGLVDQARPLVRELRAILGAARGPGAAVVPLALERAMRRG
jgi:hypothetical protein